MILGNIKNFQAGAGERRFEQGLQEAQQEGTGCAGARAALADGAQKADETKRHIDRVRTFIGYREYPKYGMVSRYFAYKQSLLEEAGRLVRAQVLRDKEDIFYLTLHELPRRRTHPAGGWPTCPAAQGRVHRISSAHAAPGADVGWRGRRRDVPAGRRPGSALVGVPVSTGSVEGRAGVILDMAEADLETDDILVTAHTDPSWTPVFVAIKGLVTEVGGLMTHGAVIAREYGLPAVVGVENATRLIRDGQRIHVNGTDGYVEIMS